MVDTFRMKSTIEDIIKDILKEKPKATMAYVLNNIHYEIGRGKYDTQAEREIKKMPLKERDEWYQRLIEPFGVKKGKLMGESFLELFTEGSVSLNKDIKAKLDDIFNDYKEQAKGDMMKLHNIIRSNFVNNQYVRSSNKEVEYMWDLYKKESK